MYRGFIIHCTILAGSDDGKETAHLAPVFLGPSTASVERDQTPHLSFIKRHLTERSRGGQAKEAWSRWITALPTAASLLSGAQ
jgi:hypothetical protein